MGQFEPPHLFQKANESEIAQLKQKAWQHYIKKR